MRGRGTRLVGDGLVTRFRAVRIQGDRRDVLDADDPEAGVTVERAVGATRRHDQEWHGDDRVERAGDGKHEQAQDDALRRGVLVVESRAHGRNQGHGAEQDRVRDEVGIVVRAGESRERDVGRVDDFVRGFVDFVRGVSIIPALGTLSTVLALCLCATADFSPGPDGPLRAYAPCVRGGVREWSFTPLGRLSHGLVAAFEG